MSKLAFEIEGQPVPHSRARRAPTVFCPFCRFAVSTARSKITYRNAAGEWATAHLDCFLEAGNHG